LVVVHESSAELEYSRYRIPFLYNNIIISITEAKLVTVEVIRDLSELSINIVLTSSNYVSDLFKAFFELSDSVYEIGKLRDVSRGREGIETLYYLVKCRTS
jgi:hypothetical protein